MDELTLEPFAARLRWTLPRPRDGQVWSVMVAAYLEDLARRCEESGRCVIGHIKSFAELPGGYLRANTTGTRAPPDTEVRSSGECSELLLTLNVLVYGIPSSDLASLVTQAAADVASPLDGNTILVEREQGYGE